eukprot:COSAG06_NODE_1881_length_8148_cov_4.613617_2_plen_204_part_00
MYESESKGGRFVDKVKDGEFVLFLKYVGSIDDTLDPTRRLALDIDVAPLLLGKQLRQGHVKQKCTKDFLDIFADTMGDRGGWPRVTNSLKCPGCMVDPGFPGMPTQSGLRMLLDQDFTVDKAAALVARFGDWHDSMCLLAKDNVHTEEHYSELISTSCSVLAQEFRGKDVSLSEHANMSRVLIGVEKLTRFDPENYEGGFQVG